tara:strand:+ start:150 stop:317 length:168 start_codon:yes stop_codon:yes gene_type:complete
MKKLNFYQLEELTLNEVSEINGGGPILDGISKFYQTMGSFYHGVWDGLFNNKKDV